MYCLILLLLNILKTFIRYKPKVKTLKRQCFKNINSNSPFRKFFYITHHHNSLTFLFFLISGITNSNISLSCLVHGLQDYNVISILQKKKKNEKKFTNNHDKFTCYFQNNNSKMKVGLQSCSYLYETETKNGAGVLSASHSPLHSYRMQTWNAPEWGSVPVPSCHLPLLVKGV